jgi:glutathione S-transferase
VISLLPGIPKGIYPEHNDAVAEEAKIGLNQALEYIETVLLKGSNQFLENAQEVSIADLSLVCEIKQLLWLESGDQEDLLGSRPRIKAWVQAVENATNPEFNKVHSSLYAMAKKIQDGRKVAGQSSL